MVADGTLTSLMVAFAFELNNNIQLRIVSAFIYVNIRIISNTDSFGVEVLLSLIWWYMYIRQKYFSEVISS